MLRSSYPSATSKTATSELSTLSLHDALPISPRVDEPARRVDLHERPACRVAGDHVDPVSAAGANVERRRLPHPEDRLVRVDRKSTRLNSSHEWISYAVFCLKKKRGTRSHHTE